MSLGCMQLVSIKMTWKAYDQFSCGASLHSALRCVLHSVGFLFMLQLNGNKTNIDMSLMLLKLALNADTWNICTSDAETKRVWLFVCNERQNQKGKRRHDFSCCVAFPFWPCDLPWFCISLSSASVRAFTSRLFTCVMLPGSSAGNSWSIMINYM